MATVLGIIRVPTTPGTFHFPAAHRTWQSKEKYTRQNKAVNRKALFPSPIHLIQKAEMTSSQKAVTMGSKRTWTQRVVGPLELLAWRIVFPLGGNAFEVVSIVLEAGIVFKHVFVMRYG